MEPNIKPGPTVVRTAAPARAFVDHGDVRIRPADNGWAVNTGKSWKVYITWESLVGDLGRHFLELREKTRLEKARGS